MRRPCHAGVKRRGLAIDAAQFDVHEAHGPVAALRFGQPDDFAPHGLAHKHQLALPLDLPGRA